MFVPVVDFDQKPLMPTIPSRARRWIKDGKATPFWKKGVFCVRFNEPHKEDLQPIAVGIDPGIKKEGYTVKSSSHTFLNIQTDSVTWVKEAIRRRRMMRKSRRCRKSPSRRNRLNRSKGGIPPSTRARWEWKLRIVNWLKKMFPISTFIVEDIKAKSKGKKKWDSSFSPLEVGKHWFYKELQKIAQVELEQGWETKELRDSLGLKKSSSKLANRFDAHCVDSWVMANAFVGGHRNPDNEELLLVIPLQFHRRQLHKLQPSKGGIRHREGGTRSLGLKRGSLVKHIQNGLCYVGGWRGENITLRSIKTGKRIGTSFKVKDCKFLCFNSWRTIRCLLLSKP